MQVPDNVVSGAVTCDGAVKQLPDVPCRMVYLQAKTGNSGAVVVGGSTVASGVNGVVLAAGTVFPVAILVDNLKRLYVFGANNDVLHYMVCR